MLQNSAILRRSLAGISLSPERHVQLHAADKSRPARFVVSLALFEDESRIPGFNFSAGTFRLDPCR
jgi:hypothetical protein